MKIGLFPDHLFGDAGYGRHPDALRPPYFALEPGKGPGEAGIIHLAGTGFGSLLLSAEAERRNIPLVYSPMIRRGRGLMRLIAALGPLAFEAGRGISCMRGIAGRARRIAAVTPQEASTIEAVLHIPRERIALCPPAYDPGILAASADAIIRRAGAKPSVTAVVPDAVASPHLILAALGKINVPAVVFGRGDEAPQGTRPGVTFVGDDTLLLSAISASSVFVDVSPRPSRMLALSAAAAGAVPVVTKRRGMEEIFGADAEYVEPTSWELMHHGITTALNREGMPHGVYRERYAPARAAAALAALYRATPA